MLFIFLVSKCHRHLLKIMVWQCLKISIDCGQFNCFIFPSENNVKFHFFLLVRPLFPENNIPGFVIETVFQVLWLFTNFSLVEKTFNLIKFISFQGISKSRKTPKSLWNKSLPIIGNRISVSSREERSSSTS